AGTASGGRGFSAEVTNPWFPLQPGALYRYTGVKDGQPSREVLRVTHRAKTITGVPCVVVDDRLWIDGHLAEKTNDWYSQDAKGNVWYFGEATAELDKSGKVTTTEGSWQSGRDGARAGILMPAHPRPGQTGLQEYYKGQAEDHFRVLGYLGKNALLVEETTPLEPGVVDHKLYVRGTGTVLERTVRGGDELNELVSVG
ncbi:MAG TPA: hypothetical protein VLK53_06110, partial [Gaiellaceae bacterium]|nr:hypothetical protein [Gaiellaceae bacterium]